MNMMCEVLVVLIICTTILIGLCMNLCAENEVGLFAKNSLRKQSAREFMIRFRDMESTLENIEKMLKENN